MRPNPLRALITLTLFLLAACASVPEDLGRSDVEALVAARGHDAVPADGERSR